MLTPLFSGVSYRVIPLALLGMVIGSTSLIVREPQAQSTMLENAAQPPLLPENQRPTTPIETVITENDLLKKTLVIAMDRNTGICWANTQTQEDLGKRFPQASLNKLVIIKAALDLIRERRLSPNTEVRWTDYARSVEGSTLSTAIFKYNRQRYESLPDNKKGLHIPIPMPSRMSILSLLESAKKGSHNDSTRLLAQVVARKLGFPDTQDGIREMTTALLASYGLVSTTATDPSGMTDEDLPSGTNAQTAIKRDLEVGMFSNALDMLSLAERTLDSASQAPIVRTNALQRVFMNSHLQIDDFAGSDHFAGFLSQKGLFLVKTGTQEDNYHMIAASRDGTKLYAVFGADDNEARKAGITLALSHRNDLNELGIPKSGAIFNCLQGYGSLYTQAVRDFLVGQPSPLTPAIGQSSFSDFRSPYSFLDRGRSLPLK